MIPSTKKIVLGSKSPRRSELMAGMGIEFSLRTKDTEESFPTSLPPTEVPLFIAHKKAEALADELQLGEICVCADTVVVIDGTILGKPVDEEDAREMLKLLSGKTHEVITGVVLRSIDKTNASTVITEVTFKELTAEEIQYYVEGFKPMDKAGAYGIQEWIGYVGVSSIKGSYFNVVGLPTQEVYQALLDF